MTTKSTISTLLMAALVATELPAQTTRSGGGGGGGGTGFGGASGVGGAEATPVSGESRGGGRRNAVSAPSQPLNAAESAELPHFSLDFTGGTPKGLVGIIEKSLGHPINVIIPEEFSDTLLPPLKMRSVTLPDLFNALTMASRKTIPVATSSTRGGGGGLERQYSYTYQMYSCGFKTEGKAREDSVWVFFVDQPREPLRHPPAECRFFQLSGYLDSYKIDDITTAIETGWKMLGEEPFPKLSFHRDTKLLIAVGEPEKLRMIDSVLEQLRGVPRGASPATTLDSRLERSADPNRK